VIVPPFDEEALIVALRRLEKDPELRRELGRQGKPRAEEFTWTKVGERRSAQLRRVFGERVGAPAVAPAGKPAQMPVATAPAQRTSR
jgi:glycosyltransferase involved in cell wall biosynthesis